MQIKNEDHLNTSKIIGNVFNLNKNTVLAYSQSQLSNGLTASSTVVASQLAPPMTVYDANSIRVVLDFERSSDPLDLSFASSVPPCVQIRASSQNTGTLPIESFELQVAVPKTFQLEMFPPSATCLLPAVAVSSIPPVTQVFKVSNPNRVSYLIVSLHITFPRFLSMYFFFQQPLRLRLRLLFTQNGLQRSEQFQIDQFPTNLFNTI